MSLAKVLGNERSFMPFFPFRIFAARWLLAARSSNDLHHLGLGLDLDHPENRAGPGRDYTNFIRPTGAAGARWPGL